MGDESPQGRSRSATGGMASFLGRGRRRTQIQPIGPLRLRCRHHYCSRPRPRRIGDDSSFCCMRTPERGSGIVGTEERSPSGSTKPKCATIRRSSRTESRLNGPSGPLPSPTFAAEDPSTSAGHLIDERRARTGARRPKEAPATRRRPFSPFHERKIGATKQIRRSKIQHPHSKE